MHPRWRVRFLILACFTIAVLPWLTGCWGSQTASEPMETSNLHALANLYAMFIGQHQGKAPANEAEFRKFVLSANPASLQGRIGSKKPEELFISSRDKEPYVILYGEAAKKGPPGPAGSPVIAYEKTGVGGVRFVASSYGAVEQANEARFKQLVPGGP